MTSMTRLIWTATLVLLIGGVGNADELRQKAHALPTKADVDYLLNAAKGNDTVDPRRAARGFIAIQATALANDRRFQQLVKDYAGGRPAGDVIKDVLSKDSGWADHVSESSLEYEMLKANARRQAADAYAARERKADAILRKQESKAREVEEAEARAERERERAIRTGTNVFDLSADTLMAMFLVLNINDPNNDTDTAEVVQEVVQEASDKIGDCLARAATKRNACLADSPNLYGNALCESAFTTDSLACLAN